MEGKSAGPGADFKPEFVCISVSLINLCYYLHGSEEGPNLKHKLMPCCE